jgi:prevent-host-death family protein
MSEPTRIIGIGEFRQRATEIVKEVETSAVPVAISRRGKPVVELRPLGHGADDLIGSVDVLEGTDLTTPVLSPEEWTLTH